MPSAHTESQVSVVPRGALPLHLACGANQAHQYVVVGDERIELEKELLVLWVIDCPLILLPGESFDGRFG